ncbi:PREDICTED: forkhead box protein R1 [Calidris pugnax]|uniref:forkhead box protein R1 n=1 Tax=Calidris pugnax TaxID=198806 RepID=UPI00071DE6EE|nr:PREDICTED: forkhead box protein R1 [Calidris pugnax]
MYLSFQNKSFWESLHLKKGLEDWDMAEELKLSVTTEEFPKGPGDQPHLWMWVKPSLVCPIPGSPGPAPDRLHSPVASAAGAAEASFPKTSQDDADPDCSEKDAPSATSEAGKFTKGEDTSRVDIPVPQEMPIPWKSVVLRPQSVKLKCSRQKSTKIKGGWPRPPLNYCLLITLALGNSASGSLSVQQIYQFTRQHFPFFQTAPEGWKSTIRHKLCFSSCFEKSTAFVCGEGNRKSCLWKLTPEGRRKFQEEAQALPKETLDLVRQSMSNPGLLRSLFGL